MIDRTEIDDVMALAPLGQLPARRTRVAWNWKLLIGLAVLFGTVFEMEEKPCQQQNVLYGTVMRKIEADRPTGRREARKQDRRQTIIEAARKAFLEQGYAAMSMSGLAKTLGGSKATLWGHFRSKEELFAAAIASESSVFRDQLEAGLLESIDVRPALFAFCLNFMRRISRPEATAAWRLVVGESGRFPELGNIFYQQAVSHVERTVARYIEGQIATGRLRDEGPDRMARFLVDMCAGRQNRNLWAVTLLIDAEVEADAERFTDYFLRLFTA